MNFRTRGKFRVRITLPAVFITLITATTLLILLLNYYSTKTSLSAIADDLMTKISEHALEKTLNHLGPAGMLVKLNSLVSDENIFQIDFNKRLEEFTIKQLMVYPQFAMVNFGNENGDFWMTKRMPDETVNTKIVKRLDLSTECEAIVKKGREQMPSKTEADKESIARLVSPCIKTTWLRRDKKGSIIKEEDEPFGCYDPRTRPWYSGAKSKAGLYWTDVYVFSSDQKPGITAGMPITKNNRFIGVGTIDMELAELSNFLKNLRIGKRGRAFIINATGDTVALPKIEELSRIDPLTENVSLNKISNISDKAIVASYDAIYNDLGIDKTKPLKLNKKIMFSFDHEGDTYLGLYKPFPSNYGWDWVIGIIVPEDDFMADVKRNTLISSVLSFVCLIIVLVLSLIISRKITLPLDQLSDASERIREFELDQVSNIDSLFVEICKMADSFENMRTGLKSFRKFVPADLVRYLISSGQEAELGGQNRELTIYFSDIANFTSISETMKPQDLVVHLGEYLSEMSTIILDNNGTVDKYIGDAVMAFWNAPKTEPNHAYLACKSALANQKRLQELRTNWESKGLPPFHARIGLNTGDVVVGNMGSAARLNYTVIGDAVNLASRLEGICKNYGVSIVISEYTYAVVKDRFIVRLLDCVSVKGKKQGVYIYELLAEKDEKLLYPIEFIEIYQNGFDEYLKRNWDKAINKFENAKKIKGKDYACDLFIDRCTIYKTTPPPDNWDGAFIMKTK